MTGPPVAATGFGVVSALGHTADDLWRACLEGRTRAVPAPAAWSHYYESRSRTWSPLDLPDYAAHGLSRADLLRYDPAVLNAVVAADDAIEAAGFERRVANEKLRSVNLEGVDHDRLGVFIGTGLGCISSAFNNYVPHLLRNAGDDIFGAESPAVAELEANLRANPRVNPFASVQSMANAIGALIAIRFNARAACETLVYACAAGTAAIGRAFRAIQHGEVDVAIAGGSEYYGDRAGGVFMAFDRMQTLVQPTDPPDAGNRPFDSARSGFLFSQGGAGIVVLESLDHARARGAAELVRIHGMSITTDARSLAAMSEDDNAIGVMFDKLLADAGLSAADIDYVNAHGTSTVQNDPIEARLIERKFPGRPLVNSTKALLGHTISASGALEFIVTALSMRDSRVHGCRNLEDPVADLNFPRDAAAADIEFAVTHSFGFGGHNAGLIVGNPH